MPAVTIDDGSDVPVTVLVEEGEALVLGREPEVSALPPTLRKGVASRVVVLPSMSVSANHAVVRCEAGALEVCDLGSRNGTWLRLAPRVPVAAPPGVSVNLRLTRASRAGRGGPEPEDPVYEDPTEYPGAVARSVARWLSARGVTADVRVSRGGDPDVASVTLPSGARLVVEPRQTVDAEALASIEGVCAWVARQNQAFVAEEETRTDGMILASDAIRRAHRAVVDSAQRGIPSVVLLGPTGAGKERLARAFHRHCGRGGPFVAVNCSLFEREFARADLFGAEVGAYTGCVKARLGAVERANGGTLFLDEVGELPVEVQALLLRFLDGDGEFERMGGDGKTRHADVRVVCATNRDLREDALRGAFRKDLWWRLSVQVVEVPPLRARFDDVAAYLRATRLGVVSAFDALRPDALDLLRGHCWEGNFRELTNCVMRLPTASGPGEIDVATVRSALSAGALSRVAESSVGLPAGPGGAGDWADVVAAAAAYAEDHGASGPGSWADVGAFVEQYLKPVALRRMVDAGAPTKTDRELCQRLQVDAKTLGKHRRRYDERFGR